jgi:hypothetical protein
VVDPQHKEIQGNFDPSLDSLFGELAAERFLNDLSASGLGCLAAVVVVRLRSASMVDSAAL